MKNKVLRKSSSRYFSILYIKKFSFKNNLDIIDVIMIPSAPSGVSFTRRAGHAEHERVLKKFVQGHHNEQITLVNPVGACLHDFSKTIF